MVLCSPASFLALESPAVCILTVPTRYFLFVVFLSFLLQGANSRPEHDLDAKDYLRKCKYYHITPLLKSPLKQIIKQRDSERNLRGSRPCKVAPSLPPYFLSFCPIKSTTKILRFNCFGGSSSPYEGSHVISL